MKTYVLCALKRRFFYAQKHMFGIKKITAKYIWGEGGLYFYVYLPLIRTTDKSR